MLVLSRTPGQEVVINGNVRIKVVSIHGDRVKLGITAPRSVSVDRGEVHARKTTYTEVLVPAAVCDESVDLGGALAAGADDTLS